MKIAIVADGDPRSASTNSGVALGILRALESDDRVEVVAEIDSSMGTWQRLISLVMTVDVNRVRWRNQYRKGRFSTWARSHNRDRAIKKSTSTPELILHVRNTYLPSELPYVAFIDNTSSISQRDWRPWALRRGLAAWRLTAEAALFNGAIAVYTAAKYVSEEVIGTYAVPRAKVLPVGGGTNLELGHCLPLEPGTSSASRILFVGIDFERKGGPDLLRAFQAVRAIHSDAELVVIGTSADLRQPGVTFAGFVSDRARMVEFYRNCDLLCLPARYEPYGLVVQEAMAHGVPCVVSDVGALPEIIGDGAAGVVFRARNIAALTAALLTLIEDPALARAKGMAGQQLLQDMTWRNVADRIVDDLTARVGV